MMANTASPSWTSPMCGLHTKADARAVPLTGVQVEASIAGRCARVTLTQRYQGLEDAAVEAIYTFPLDEGAAVCGFEARIGDRLVKGLLDDKARAFDAYDDALAEGRGAALLEQKRPNIFTVSVGHLKPGDEVEVRLSYVSLLPQQGPGVRFVVPTTIAPRSGRGGALAARTGAQIKSAKEVPYRLNLDVHVATDPPLRVIESPSHPLRVIVGPKATTVSVSSDELAMDRDFVLYLETVEAHAPKVRMARDTDGVAVLMVTFYPDPDSLPTDGEQYHLIIDASGSVAGDAFVQARQAALIFIEALVTGDSFNIHAVGGESLWPEPMPTDDAHREAARRFVRGLSPAGDKDLGAPLRALRQGLAGVARQIVIITDGAVRDEADLIGLCKGLGAWDRVFPVGVGAAPNGWLLRRMATVGGGVAEVVHPGERIAPAVWRTVGRAGAPVLQHVHLDWEGLDVEQAPALCPPVFGGDSLTVFGRVRGGLHGSVTLQADGRSWRVPVNLASAEQGGPIPLLWAREALRAMESRLERPGGSLQGRQQQRRDAMIALSKRTGLLCSATGYVAVEETSATGAMPLDPKLRAVPIALATGLLPEALPEPRRAEQASDRPPADTFQRQPLPAPPPSLVPPRTAASQPAIPSYSSGGTFDEPTLKASLDTGAIDDLFQISVEGPAAADKKPVFEYDEPAGEEDLDEGGFDEGDALEMSQDLDDIFTDSLEDTGAFVPEPALRRAKARAQLATEVDAISPFAEPKANQGTPEDEDDQVGSIDLSEMFDAPAQATDAFADTAEADRLQPPASKAESVSRLHAPAKAKLRASTAKKQASPAPVEDYGSPLAYNAAPKEAAPSYGAPQARFSPDMAPSSAPMAADMPRGKSKTGLVIALIALFLFLVLVAVALAVGYFYFYR